MNVRDLIPWSRNDRDFGRGLGSESLTPVMSLHREMNRLFDDMFRGTDDSRMWGGRRGEWPQHSPSAHCRANFVGSAGG